MGMGIPGINQLFHVIGKQCLIYPAAILIKNGLIMLPGAVLQSRGAVYN